MDIKLIPCNSNWWMQAWWDEPEPGVIAAEQSCSQALPTCERGWLQSMLSRKSYMQPKSRSENKAACSLTKSLGVTDFSPADQLEEHLTSIQKGLKFESQLDPGFFPVDLFLTLSTKQKHHS